MAFADQAQAAIVCDDCEETVDVFHYCLNCPGALCSNCKQSHERRKMTRDHAIAPFNDPSVKQMRIVAAFGKCSKHPANQLAFFCSVCDAPYCADCTKRHDKHHKIWNITDKVASTEKEMLKYMKGLQAEVGKISFRIKEKEDEINLENTCAEDAEKKLRDALSAVHEVIDKEGQALLKRIQNTKDNNILKLKDQIAQQNEKEQKCKKEIVECNFRLNGNFREMISFKKDLSCFLPTKTQGRKRGEWKFVSSTISKSNIQKMIGRIVAKKEEDSSSYESDSD